MNLDYNSVQHICRKATRDKIALRVRNPERRLEQEHVEYLTSEQTLQSQCGFTLKERCAKFEHLFAPKKLCATTLRRLYLKHKIRRKSVKELKPIPQEQPQKYQEWKVRLLAEIGRAT